MNQDLSSGDSQKRLDHIRAELERTKRVTSHGRDYWSARDLVSILGYDTWRRFEDAIDRAKTSCETFGQSIKHHFADSGKMVSIGSGADREVKDIFLSRYACYLIVQNGDPSKIEISAGQAYFAIQTHRQELQDDEANAFGKRIVARERMIESNKKLFGAAKGAGVRSPMFGIFNDEGYKGLYDGMGTKALKQFKGVPANEDLLDRMGHTELAANDFRATQARERLEREGIHNESHAFRVHREVGESVRKAITDQGNTPPEKLPLEPNIKPIIEKTRREEKKRLGGGKT